MNKLIYIYISVILLTCVMLISPAEAGDRRDFSPTPHKHFTPDPRMDGSHRGESLQKHLDSTSPYRYGDWWDSDKGKYNRSSPYSPPYNRPSTTDSPAPYSHSYSVPSAPPPIGSTMGNK